MPFQFIFGSDETFSVWLRVSFKRIYDGGNYAADLSHPVLSSP